MYKKKDPTLVENYRPVSELPCVSKVFERILQKQISSSIGKFIFPYLCGSRNGFNTQYAFLSLIEKWKKILDGKGYTASVLMELLKAFDTINYDFLNAKLYAKGFYNNDDDTIPYVCGKKPEFVLTKLEEHSIIAIEWFENNYMKMNSD